MEKVPSAVWVVDSNKEHIAIKEARKLGIPVISILDTNCDPDEVDYPVPGNDDAMRSVALLTRVIADAVADGLQQRAKAASGDESEPLAEWEKEILDSSEKKAEAASSATVVEGDASAEEAKAEATAVEEVAAAEAATVEAAAAEVATEESAAAAEEAAQAPTAEK